MPWHLATDANIRALPVHDQLFEFAHSYLTSAQALCQRAAERAEQRDWPAGAVVLMNTAHAVELFLKAVLLRKGNTSDVWSFGHDIGALANEYNRQFPEARLVWDVPFRSAVPQDLPPDQVRVFREGTAPATIEFRYPVNKRGYPWITLQGFEPHSFLKVLAQLESDFDRIYKSAA